MQDYIDQANKLARAMPHSGLQVDVLRKHLEPTRIENAWEDNEDLEEELRRIERRGAK